MQPLYATEMAVDQDGVRSTANREPLRGKEASLAYFSHIDVLAYCILDLFKCAAARGPGGNNGEFIPYVTQGAKTGLDLSKTAGGGLDAAGRPFLEALTWSRFVMFLADCSPPTIAQSFPADGVKVFLPPVAYKLLPPSGSNLASEAEPSSPGKKISVLDKYHSQPLGETYDVGRVRMIKLWEERGLCVLLTDPPKDGSSGESIHFINVQTARCTRIQHLNNRYGNVTSFELLPSPHNTIACAYLDGVRLYDIETFAVKAFVPESETVTTIRYIPTIDQLALGNKSGDVRFYSSLTALDKQFALTRTQTEQSHAADHDHVHPPAERNGRSGAPHPPGTMTDSSPQVITITSVVGHHQEAVCEILPEVLNENVVVSTSLDNSLCFYNVESKVARKTSGGVVVLGAAVVQSLGLLFCFGVDVWPFVWSFNVLGSKPVSLSGGKLTGSDKQCHSGRILAVYSLPAPRHSAASLDKNGGIRIWDLWRMCLIQSIDISSEYVGSFVPYFKNPSGRVSAFTNFAFDPRKIRLFTFVRQRAFSIKYNRKDDLRTTMLASFEPINQMRVIQDNNLLLSTTSKSATIWNLLTAKQIFTIHLQSLFSTYLSQTSGGKRMPIVTDEGDSCESDQDSADEAGGNKSALVPGKKKSQHQYAGLDIVAVQVIEQSRTVFLGLSSGGIVVCSLGNGSIICCVPPVPYFYGSNGIFSSDDGMTAAQEIAATARFAGDFRTMFYYPEQDTLFMTGAGHTFFEHRGRRHELLTEGVRSVDANVITLHTFTGLVMICEESGTVSAWAQQDQAIHVDSWARVAHTELLDTVSGLMEIPGSPFVIAYNARGFITLLRFDVSLELTDDASRDSMWPGYRKEREVRNNKQLQKLMQRYPPEGSKRRDASPMMSKEMSCSVLRKFRRHHATIQRKKSIVSYWAKGEADDQKSGSRRVGTVTSRGEGGTFEVTVPPADVISLKGEQWPMGGESGGKDKDTAFTPEVSCRDSKPILDRWVSSMKKTTARQRLLKKEPTLMPHVLLPVEDTEKEDLSPAQSTTSPTSIRKSLAKGNLGLSMSSMSTVSSNSIVKLSQCRLWSHVRINPYLQQAPSQLESVMCSITATAFQPDYSFLYVGDEIGYITIYDLTFAIMGHAEEECWKDAARRSRSEADVAANTSAISGIGSGMGSLPRFSPIPKSSQTLEEMLTLKTITVVRRIRAHASSVMSLSITTGPFGCLHSSGLDGTIQLWSLFLQTQYGNITLGEETSTSVLRYPSFPIQSRYAHLLLEVMDVSPSAQQPAEERTRPGRVPQVVSEVTGRPPRKNHHIVDALKKERQPILMLPTQMTYSMLEFEASTKVGSEGERETFNSPDPGGPCQPSAIEAATDVSERSYNSGYLLHKRPEHTSRGMNPATSATIQHMSAQEFNQLCLLVSELAAPLEEGGTKVTSEHLAGTRAELEGTEPNALPQAISLTSVGWTLLYEKYLHKSGLYDDIPKPYNSFGALDVAQQPPFPVLSFRSRGKQKVDNTGSAAISFSVPGQDDYPLLPLPDQGATLPTSNIEAVVMYKDWCLAQQHVLESFALRNRLGVTDLSHTKGRPEATSKGSPVRMADAMRVFQSLHSACVGDVEEGRVKNEKSFTSEIVGKVGGQSLPPIFGSRRIQRPMQRSEGQPLPATDQLSVNEAIGRACLAAQHSPTSKFILSSQQSINAQIEVRQSTSVVGYPPLLTPALLPTRASLLARAKTSTADDEPSDVDEESVDSDGIHDVDEWKVILEREKITKKQQADSKEALASLQKQHRKQLVANKSKGALLSGIRDEGVLDKLVHVFSKGSMHTTLAYLLTKEQDERSSHVKLAPLATKAPQSELSPSTVMGYCNTFNKEKELSDLLNNAPTLSASITRTGDMSALRPDITQTIPLKQKGSVRAPLVTTDLLSHAPAGRPVSPYVLKKCSHQAFKGLLSERLVHSHQEIRSHQSPEETSSVAPKPIRLKNGLPLRVPSIPKQNK